MKEGFVYQVITEPKSASIGVDWLMIRAAREAAQPQKDFRERVPADFYMERLEKQPLGEYHAPAMVS